MHGLKRGLVKLIAHDKKWDSIFKIEKNKLQKTLGRNVHIEHIGSTSVKTIAAKPIIDIVIGIDKISDFSRPKNKLEKIGYQFHSNRGTKFRKFFTKGPETLRKFYIHFVRYNGQEWKKLVNFKNLLIRNKKIANKYNDLKRGLAKETKDRYIYTKKKAKFFTDLLKRNKL